MIIEMGTGQRCHNLGMIERFDGDTDVVNVGPMCLRGKRSIRKSIVTVVLRLVHVNPPAKHLWRTTFHKPTDRGVLFSVLK
jgi:hypothetical protein